MTDGSVVGRGFTGGDADDSASSCTPSDPGPGRQPERWCASSSSDRFRVRRWTLCRSFRPCPHSRSSPSRLGFSPFDPACSARSTGAARAPRRHSRSPGGRVSGPKGVAGAREGCVRRSRPHPQWQPRPRTPRLRHLRCLRRLRCRRCHPRWWSTLLPRYAPSPPCSAVATGATDGTCTRRRRHLR